MLQCASSKNRGIFVSAFWLAAARGCKSLIAALAKS
tara:strand:- start:396 stop:503 length:108 start_codon:yes stop_codon:yes gene_type:complete